MAKFKKEENMCRVYARAGNKLVYLAEKPGVSSSDVLFNGKLAELKAISSHNNLYKEAKDGVYKKGAELMLFRFDSLSPKMQKELNRIVRKEIHGKFYVIGKEHEIFVF